MGSECNIALLLGVVCLACGTTPVPQAANERGSTTPADRASRVPTVDPFAVPDPSADLILRADAEGLRGHPWIHEAELFSQVIPGAGSTLRELWAWQNQMQQDIEADCEAGALESIGRLGLSMDVRELIGSSKLEWGTGFLAVESDLPAAKALHCAAAVLSLDAEVESVDAFPAIRGQNDSLAVATGSVVLIGHTDAVKRALTSPGERHDFEGPLGLWLTRSNPLEVDRLSFIVKNPTQVELRGKAGSVEEAQRATVTAAILLLQLERQLHAAELSGTRKAWLQHVLDSAKAEADGSKVLLSLDLVKPQSNPGKDTAEPERTMRLRIAEKCAVANCGLHVAGTIKRSVELWFPSVYLQMGDEKYVKEDSELVVSVTGRPLLQRGKALISGQDLGMLQTGASIRGTLSLKVLGEGNTFRTVKTFSGRGGGNYHTLFKRGPSSASFENVLNSSNFHEGLAAVVHRLLGFQGLVRVFETTKPTVLSLPRLDPGDDAQRIRGVLLEYLSKIKDPERVDLLLQAMSEPAFLEIAASALGTAGDERAVLPLIDVLQHDPAVRPNWVLEVDGWSGTAYPADDAVLRRFAERVQDVAKKSLVKLTGRNFGTDAKKWLSWWRDEVKKRPDQSAKILLWEQRPRPVRQLVEAEARLALGRLLTTYEERLKAQKSEELLEVQLILERRAFEKIEKNAAQSSPAEVEAGRLKVKNEEERLREFRASELAHARKEEDTQRAVYFGLMQRLRRGGSSLAH